MQLELIEQEMENEPLKCFKYNYTIDGENAKYSHFNAVLSVSDDGEKLIIKTIRPNSEFNKPKFILEADRK